ncbi:MAG: 2,3,4,5-tetrahydropyridine-2,6-dicarboxylate N-succinyltransferase [Candidatus Eremiobacteraeota bacterium]|nr:2,3,4,5-tetrahydropyridine-2,6-dicarboxylate N-succinyltransferase [Candidatus Eremiobacteraeota bacterium]
MERLPAVWNACRSGARDRTVTIDELRDRVERLARGEGDVRSRDGRAIDDVIEMLDEGTLRVAEPSGGDWITHAWVKQAILLYFARRDSDWIGERDGLVFFDKLPLKKNYKKLGVRCVPPGVARYGSFLGRGVILMPAYVNIGAYVDENTMVDTWATVGSCAQIGKNVHLSGGVGIGGVLEPPQASPVVVEDGAFIGSRCIVVEGVRVEREAVLGAGVVLTASTPVVDVRGGELATSKGCVPARAVVIPGTLPKRFPAGEFGAPCALIVGTRSESTDRKTSLNAALREFEVAV